jgi:hypothetical protein
MTAMWILLGIGDGARARDDDDYCESAVIGGPHCSGVVTTLAGNRSA